MEKTLAYFVTNLHKARFFQRRVSEKVIETIEIPAYLMVIFPPGVRCNSSHSGKFWMIEFHRDTTGLAIASIELFGIPPETQPHFDREEFATKNLILGDDFFMTIEGKSRNISLERIVGEDTLDYGYFLDKFFSEKKLPGRAVKTRMLGWPQ